MNDLVRLYEAAGDTSIPTADFEARLAGLYRLSKPQLLELTQRLGLILPSRISTELLRIRIRERIRNRRAAALRCLMILK